MDRKDLKVKGMDIKVTVQVGKNGLNSSIVKEIDEQLEKRDLIKVKMLRSMGPSDRWVENIKETALNLSAEIVEIKGGTVLLYRKGRKRS
jgi:RNA-binding protein